MNNTTTTNKAPLVPVTRQEVALLLEFLEERSSEQAAVGRRMWEEIRAQRDDQ